VLDAVFMLDIK